MKQRPPTEVAAGVARYRALLDRYAGTLDLMSGEGHGDLDRHLADAAAYASAIAGLSPAPQRMLDVGSGVGLPGLVIAVSLPELEVELVERRRRRTAFLSMAVAAAGTANATVRAGDVRRLDGPAVGVVTAQAVGRLQEVYRLTRHRHAPTITLLSRKGPGWRDELVALADATSTAPEVVVDRPLGRRGTLVAVRLPGGMPCRSSV